MCIDVHAKHFASFLELMIEDRRQYPTRVRKFNSTVVYCRTRRLSSNQAKVVRQGVSSGILPKLREKQDSVFRAIDLCLKLPGFRVAPAAPSLPGMTMGVVL